MNMAENFENQENRNLNAPKTSSSMSTGIVFKALSGKKWKMREIEMMNFKSFEGQQKAGPFSDYTSIIGPNGSGKSNLLDAMTFCLHLKKPLNRGKHLRELVFRRDNESWETNDRHMAVSLSFENALGEVITLRRELDSGGVSFYKVLTQKQGTKEMTTEEYHAFLKQEGLYLPNFMVYQGMLEEMGFKGGQALTEIFENLSGSIEFKEAFD